MNLDTRLQTAVGNGAGLALSPQDVLRVIQWKKDAEKPSLARKTSLFCGAAEGQDAKNRNDE
jgi:hypothetical protein